MSKLRIARTFVFPCTRLPLETLERRTFLSTSVDFGSLALGFERNVGQSDSAVDYLAHASGYTVFLDNGSATIALASDERTSASVRMRLVGANPNAAAIAGDRLETRSNYFLDDDPSQWRTNIPNFAKVSYADVYPGIEAVYYGNQHQLEYDFVVAAGADPNQIRATFDGADALHIDSAGALHVTVGDQELFVHKPYVYQRIGNSSAEVEASFELSSDGRTVGFNIGAYDTTRSLVIDPVLGYSTYLGGTGYDTGNAIDVDNAGNAYITGVSGTTNFPVTPGAYQTTNPAHTNAGFVAKLNAAGTALEYATYISGATPHDIAIDAAGAAYITGYAGAGFVTTAGAFVTPQWGFDAFVVKLNPQGSDLLYSSRFGGDFDDFGNGIAIDGAGNAVITGTTFNYQPQSTFPTVNAFQPEYGGGTNDGFVTKLNASGSAPVFSTHLGGGEQNINLNADWGQEVAVDPSGNIYVAGYTYSPDFPTTAGVLKPNGGISLDGFVTKFAPSGAVVYSTFVGGPDHDEVWAIAVDDAGNAYITGNTDGSYPTTAGAYQTNATFHNFAAFASKINPTGSAFVYSTYVDDNVFEDWVRGWDIAVDSAGQAVIVGDTDGPNLPPVNAVQPNFGGGLRDAFVTKLNSAGSALLYETFLGGNLFDEALGVALDATGAAYVTGNTSSFNFPTTPGAFQPQNAGGLEHHDDAFVTKIVDASANSSIAGTVFNDANGNQRRDAGEPGLPGWTIYIDANDNAVLDAAEARVTSTGSGNWAFTQLLAGDYLLRQIVPRGWAQTTPQNNSPLLATVSPGATINGQMFGDRRRIGQHTVPVANSTWPGFGDSRISAASLLADDDVLAGNQTQ